MNAHWHRLKLGIVGATFAVCGAAVFIRPLPPRRAPEPRPQELFDVLMQELEAVREADYSRAYRHVSLSMQERYNADDFAVFVRTERPEFARFERVEFGAIAVQGRHALVPAYFFLPGGEIALVHYTLVREEGEWKIDGSRLDHRWGRGHRVGGERT
jgi:hypothetical protein